MNQTLTTIPNGWKRILTSQLSHLIENEKLAKEYGRKRKEKHLLSRETVFLLYCNAIKRYHEEAFNQEVTILLQTPKFSYPDTTQNDTQLSDELALYGSIFRGWNLVTAILDQYKITHPDRYDANVVNQWYCALTYQKPISATPANNSDERLSTSYKSLIFRNKKPNTQM